MIRLLMGIGSGAIYLFLLLDWYVYVQEKYPGNLCENESINCFYSKTFAM
jgi:hypothetical protein